MIAFARYEAGSPKTLWFRIRRRKFFGRIGNMNYLKIPLVVLLSIVLTGLVSIDVASAHFETSQGQSTALERGYRTGYSDGYTSGFRDVGDGAARDYQGKEEYQRADRSYNNNWGPIEDYRDGYRQGFEAGYGAGYDRQQFDSTIPSGLHRRQQAEVTGGPGAANEPETTASNTDSGSASAAYPRSMAIPRNTILTLELLAPISTDASQPNDPFRTRVTDPSEFAGFIVVGRVSRVKRPGKVKGVAELQLSFEQVLSPDNRTASLHAELLEVVSMSQNSRTEVDPEGGVRGQDSTKDDVTKVGAATGVGAIIGAIVGGGKGAAIGAVIGGGAGTAGVMTQRGKNIRLEQGQQLKIRTSTDTGVQ
jgi:hypothetical protein